MVHVKEKRLWASFKSELVGACDERANRLHVHTQLGQAAATHNVVGLGGRHVEGVVWSGGAGPAGVERVGSEEGVRPGYAQGWSRTALFKFSFQPLWALSRRPLAPAAGAGAGASGRRWVRGSAQAARQVVLKSAGPCQRR